ncbi:MAG: metal-binding protein, partial [Desulfobacterales bacterium]
RDEALAEVTRMFASKTYRKKMNQLQKRFSRPDTIQAGPEAGECSRGFGSALILKRYAQVCRIAATIDDSTEDEIVHQLRISCKKLRYLMEFLTPLFPSAEMKGLIKRLKKLQDNLGKFNDFSVQQNFLRQIVLDDLQHFNKHELEVTEAIGALTAMLFRLQQKERAQVMKNFAKFNSEETKAMFTALFQKEEGA